MAAIPNPIPFEAIDRWAQRFGPHDETEFDEFLTMIRALDGVYLEHSMPKGKPKDGKSKDPDPTLETEP